MQETLEERGGTAVARRTAVTRFSQALSGAILMAAGAGALIEKAARAQSVTDVDILNFALNLEYLEAEYYTLATQGKTIDQVGIGITGTGTQGTVVVKSSPVVPFTTTAIQQLAQEIASDERAHVTFLRTSLGGNAVARPQIDLQNSFNAAAAAAGIGSSFDPFADETSFLLGAFVFEDVGVTAYKGASPLISNKTYLGAAAGILGTEAYHAGAVRTRIFKAGASPQALAQKISDLRDAVDGPTDDDQGVTANGNANIVPADSNSVAFSRSTSQVLSIVYLNATGAAGVTSGGFFPNGLNGTIKST